jgi:hypothetical protein
LLHGIDFEAVEKVYYELDVSKAQATRLHDREDILAGIEAGVLGGHRHMTAMIKLEIVASAQQAAKLAEPLLATDGWEHAEALLDRSFSLLRVVGRSAEAEGVARAVLECSASQQRPDDPFTAKWLGSLAGLLGAQGAPLSATCW